MTALNTTSQKLDMELDIIGQQPLMTEIYTQISFVFPVTDDSTHPAITDTFNKGLQRLSQAFPWVAGQVKKTDTDALRITPFEEIPRMIVKDLRDDPSAPTMEALRKAEFPMKMFDENVIAPRKTLPIGISPDEPSPVLIFQLNFIQGGIIFTVNGQHACMDMVGQDEITRLLSKACRNEEFTEEEIKVMTLERKGLVPLIDDYELDNELKHQVVKPPSTESAPAPPKASWAFFSFSPEALSELKDEATQTLQDGVDGAAKPKFISTDDALSAFIWQCTSRVRLPRVEESARTLFCRAVDVRTQLDVPKDYPGILQNMAYSSSTLSQIANEPLGAVASRLRSQLGRESLRRRTQAFVSHIAKHPGTLSVTADANPSTDIMLSSWAKTGWWNYDFGLGLGKPESVRRPIFEPMESLMYLMPKRPDGEITAALSLRDEDMEILKGDENWTKFGRYIG
ncbi:acetyltransferase [Fusarium flagelliforme]|uniref:acetyltransferase n=1 Tax=Fusarium flagelliforme TaxID=2675880 RepID=UPI001E8D0C8B|nr:acetyltransferase [Fusarium flagelliforme]KAH7174893.1 acetyltransferase [Fusarium flagelliforme]